MVSIGEGDLGELVYLHEFVAHLSPGLWRPLELASFVAADGLAAGRSAFFEVLLGWLLAAAWPAGSAWLN